MKRRVLLTREIGDIEKDKKEFLRRGMGIVKLPLIKTVDIPFTCPDKNPDYIVFQSKRAFEYFEKRAVIPPDAIIIAVGEKTRRFIEDKGYKVSLVPKDQRAGGICEIMETQKRGVVWIPRAEAGREEAILCLRRMGFTVFPFPVYKTFNIYYKPSVFICRVKRVDAVVFASPSAVVGFFENFKNCRGNIDLQDILIVSIGKTTKTCLGDYGIEKVLTPSKPSMEAVAEYLANIWHGS